MFSQNKMEHKIKRVPVAKGSRILEPLNRRILFCIGVIRPFVSPVCRAGGTGRFVVKSLVLGFVLQTLFVDVYSTVAGFRFYLRQFCDELYFS